MEVVNFNDLDIQIKDFAEKGRADLRIEAKPVTVKKAG